MSSILTAATTVGYCRSLVGFEVPDNHECAMDVASAGSSGSPERFGGVADNRGSSVAGQMAASPATGGGGRRDRWREKTRKTNRLT